MQGIFNVLNDKCEPIRATRYSACVDLRASANIDIDMGQTVLIPLGVTINLEKLRENWENSDTRVKGYDWESFLLDHYIELLLRSGTSKHLVIKNGKGCIDLDYKKEIQLRVYNDGMKKISICMGDRVAQCTILKHYGRIMGYNSEEERTSGFGSTGIK